MCRKYAWLIAVIATVLFAACPLEGDVNFGDGEEYTITYSANGGIGSAPASQTVESGARTVLPSAEGLSRTGYVFGGWCENAAGTGTKFAAGSAYTMPNSNITLYAFWNNNTQTQTHTVTFNANGGSGSAPAAQTVAAGSSITLPGAGGMSRSDHSFGGWSANAAGTGTNYNAGDSYSVNDNVTLYAKWNSTVKTFTVRFDANGAADTPPPAQTVAAGTVITLPGNYGMQRGTDFFQGWAINPSGRCEYLTGFYYTVTADTTFYANWVTSSRNGRAYTISLSPNGGQYYDSNGRLTQARSIRSQVMVGATIRLPDPAEIWGYQLTKSGYTFGGWNIYYYSPSDGTEFTNTYPVGASVHIDETSSYTFDVIWRGGGGGGYIPGTKAPGSVPPSSVVGAR